MKPNHIYILFDESNNKVAMQIHNDSISVKFSKTGRKFIDAVKKGLESINSTEIERTHEGTCLLCKKTYSTDRNSHITPMAIIKSMVGKRNTEESHEIAASEGKLDVYYGRANLKNTSTEIKQDHHARDFWFCPSCESKLGVIESALSEWINTKIKAEKYASEFESKVSKEGIPYKVFKNKKINSSVFHAFIASLIWRLSLKYRIEEDALILSLQEEEKLRKSIFNCLSDDIKDVQKSKITINPFIVLTSDEFEDATKNCVFTAEFMQQPNIFSFNEYVVIFFGEDEIITEENNLNLEQFIKSLDIINYPKDAPKIAYIDKAKWDEILKEIMQMALKAFLHSLVKELMPVNGKDYHSCKRKIFTLAQEIEKDKNLPFGDCCIKATKILIKNAKK